jgi:shikimate dehydrogenase
LDIRATSRVLGVIGDPIAHSFSPDMHNAAIQALGLDYVYVAFHVRPEGVATAIEGLRGLGIRGLNVTIPHKVSVMGHVDRISEEALAVGAANTLSLESDELIGYNTDVYGVLTALGRVAGLSTLPASCVVLGAGGAARAVVYALGTQPEVERVVVLNRTVDRAERLAADMTKITGKSITAATMDRDSQAKHLAEAGLVVNATSVGMHPKVDACPLDPDLEISPDLVLYDTVFNPLETQLMARFRAAGAPAFGGLDMLVFQGARSFEIWTGIEPPTDVMKQAVVGRFQS